MKKLFLIALSVLLIMAAAPAAFAASVDVAASVNNATGEVTISGTISSGAGNSVTVLVKSPNGNIDYVDQTMSGAGGAYQFVYSVAVDKTGTYRVSIGGAGVNAVSETSFLYEGPGTGPGGEEPGGEEGPGNGGPDSGSGGNGDNNGDGVGTPPAGGNGNAGGVVKWTPSASDVTRQTKSDGTTAVRVVFNSGQLKEALDQLNNLASDKQTIVIEIEEGTEVSLALSGDTIQSAIASGTKAVLRLQTEQGYYELPLQVLNGKVPPGATVVVSVKKADAAVIDDIADRLGASALTEAVEFAVMIEQAGTVQEFNDFGNTYISRGIVVADTVDSNQATGVLYDPESGEFTFVPTVFHSADGQTTAVLKRNGNSIYTVIQLGKSFGDIAGSFAKGDIEMLASKLIINGKSESVFDPGGNITRAEFAALLVRSLGLVINDNGVQFTDVRSGDWHSGVVATAVHSELVNGYADHTFRPNQPISREEMAVLIARAIAFTGTSTGTSGVQILDDKFNDGGDIAPWAQDSVATAVEAGIINGVTADTFVPKRNATRAEAAAMIKRLLQHVDFIN